MPTWVSSSSEPGAMLAADQEKRRRGDVRRHIDLTGPQSAATAQTE
jgi:hypothetical protein